MISLIIPHMPFPESDAALKECLDSIIGVDETLIIINDGIGYGKAVNIGLQLARGDHLIVANNDTKLIKGTLRSLADSEAVTVPLIEPEPKDYNPRAFFCLPRWVYEKVGGFDERFEVGYWEDDDLISRLSKEGVKTKIVYQVEVTHKDGGGLTMKRMGEQKYYDENKKRYEDKWD